MTNRTLDEFLTTYGNDREVIEIDLAFYRADQSPYIVVKHGEYAVVLHPMGLSDHLCVDAHPFVDGKEATAAAFGMTEGVRSELTSAGTKSYGWPSDVLVALLIGRQARQ